MPIRLLAKPVVAALLLLALAIPVLGARQVTPVAAATLTNSSLEADANGDRVPDCWQPKGDGQHKASFSWTKTAHSGKHAEQLAVTRYESGWRGLFVQMGDTGCGPTVQAGRSYAVSVWFKTDGNAHLTTFYRDASGAWLRWTSGPALPQQRSWGRADWVTPALPAGATELSLGIELRSGGTLTTDDYSLVDTAESGSSPTSSATTSPSSPATATTSSSPTSGPTTSSPPSGPTTSSPTSAPTSSSPTASSPTSSSPTSSSPTTSSPTTSSPTSTTTPTAAPSTPPPAGGYFPTLVAPGNAATLPSGGSCANAVHRSTWEPRPDNYKPNHTLVDAAAVHASFAQRTRSGLGTYDPKWDSWLLARVDGQFTGTTDEIIQWAACKWGLPDDFLRAEAHTESTWFQSETYPSGRCVDMYGCGDWFNSEPYAARKTYCSALALSGGYDYQKDYGDGMCPKTFSIIGIMSWWSPSWGFSWAGNQNGTFPFTRNSTAMSLDYMASQIRGCYEGWQWALDNGTNGYAAGDLWGCSGSWYSGEWHDSRAEAYIATVKQHMSAKPWLLASFAAEKPACDPKYGCPGGTVLP